jgi:hypothetical protein
LLARASLTSKEKIVDIGFLETSMATQKTIPLPQIRYGGDCRWSWFGYL